MLEISTHHQVQLNGRMLTRTQLKKMRRKGLLSESGDVITANLIKNQGLELKRIKPKTLNQADYFKLYGEGYHMLAHGYAGTGKSFLALYLALNTIMKGDTPFKKVLIVRSAVASRSLGFLPGSEKEKLEVFEAPYKSICAELFGRGDAYQILKNKGIVQFVSTSYLRGETFNDTIVIVDEIQNMVHGEADTVMTRMGQNVRVLLCGDFRQSDLENKRFESSAIHDFIDAIDHMKSFAKVEMQIEDICRNELVKEWIIARERNK